nr:hypothetical protein HK105_005752 [Polyrhizophydium stewartii]
MSAAPCDFSLSIKSRLEQLAQYISTESNQPSLSLEVLLDAFLAVYTDCKAASNNNEQIAGFIAQYDQLVPKLQTMRVNTRDFETIKTLATGAVGRVCLVRAKKDSNVYAMKILKKSDLLTRREAAFFMEERNALVFSQQSEWITTLYAAFQDDDNLYLVMEYVSGGSLRSLLNNRETSMDEAEARFYVAEMILALEVLHRYSYIHRDVKPENCLIDSSGHIKLADFGSCIRLSEASRVTSHETVGTPDYISPEILRAHEGNANYGQSVDWWSLGVILYELLFDEVPFYSESLVETYGKIMDHEKHFAFPDDVEITAVCRDLIQKLICNAEVRLGSKSIDEIKSHPWFEGVPWSTIRETKPPFVPELSGPEDTRYFEDEENESKKFAKKPLAKNREFSGRNLPFVGYTYVKNATALISWPDLGTGGTESKTGTLSRAAAARDRALSTTAANSAANIAKIEELRTQLQQESQKSSALASSKKQLEDEAATLRSTLARESSQRAELQSAVSGLEKDRIRLETELKQLRLASDRDSHNIADLESKLSQLRSSQESEVQNKAEMHELVEIRKRLEREVANLAGSLKEEKAQSVRREIGVSELSKAKSMLDKETERLSHALQEEKKLRADAQAKADAQLKRVEAETARADHLEARFNELQIESARQASEVKTLRESLALSNEKSLRVGEQSAKLEKENAVLQVEVSSLQQRLSEAETLAGVLQKAAQELQESQRETVDHEIESLRGQVSSLGAARNKLAEELSQVGKAKALLEMERTDVRNKLAAETASHAETRQALDRAQQQLGEQTQRLAIVDEARKKLEAQIAELQSNNALLAEKLAGQDERVAELESEAVELRSAKQTLVVELSDMTVKYEQEAGSAAALRDQVAELQETCATELKSRVASEWQHAAVQQINSQLHHDIERLRARVDTITREHENSITEHHAAISDLKAASQVQEERLAAEKEQRYQLEDAKASLERWLKELEEDLSREGEARERLEKALDAANRRARELGAELETELVREQQLHERVNDLEHLAEALKFKLEAAEEREREREREIQLAQQTNDAKQRIDERSHQRFKLRGLFFKNSREPDSGPLQVPERHTQRLQDSDDDIRNSKEAEHRRKQSSQSMDSLASSLRLVSPIGPKNPETASIDFWNPNEQLQGWLKVPKGGKVKKGWKLQYAVVRDFKIVIFERDQDVDTMPGVTMIDITADIFLAKAVSQNEVIHANGKDIDLIFKVQTWSASGSTDEIETLEIQQRIQKLQTDVKLEENMQQAAEKILGVTSDAQKVLVISQIDSSNRRLRALKNELDKLLPLVNKSLGSANASMSSSKDSMENASQAESLGSKAADEYLSLRKELEAQLEDENKKREALSKLTHSDARKKQKEPKDVDVELLTSDRIIAKIKEGLEILNSGDREKMDALVQKMRKTQKTADQMGHFFTTRQFYKPTDCSVCHEALWDTKNQGLECTACRMICHKSCKPQVDVACQDIIKLQKVAPTYFLAKDPQDRARWLVGLGHMRKEYERTRRGIEGVAASPDKRMSSFIETPGSKRLSGIISGHSGASSRRATITGRN